LGSVTHRISIAEKPTSVSPLFGGQNVRGFCAPCGYGQPAIIQSIFRHQQLFISFVCGYKYIFCSVFFVNSQLKTFIVFGPEIYSHQIAWDPKLSK